MKSGSLHARIVTVAFCAALAAAAAASFLWPQRLFSETENRYLAQKPAFSWDTLKSGKFGKSYETYLSDQFPLRDRFIGLKVEAEQAQLKQEINGVYLGSDGYLIEALYEEDIDNELYEKNMTRLRSFATVQAESLGEDHVRIMLVPSASEILVDELPVLAAPFKQEQVTQDLSPLLVPVRSALTESYRENNGAQLYYRTDHHWTTYGAFVAYQAWQKSLVSTDKRSSGSTAKRPVRALEDFTRQTVTSEFYGTIHSKLNIASTPDSITLFLPNENPTFEVYYDGSADAQDSLYSMDALQTKDKYRVFLDGNHALTKIVNPEVADGRLLIVKDSFAHCFAPFAALDYNQVHMLDLRYYNGKVSSYIEEEGITDILVLYQIPGFIGDANVSKLVR